MNVDHVDLWQMHILVDPAEWETAMGPGGALEAFIQARDEGLVDYLGVTGHGLTICDMHLKSLERFPFDSVLLPWNWMMSRNTAYKDGFERLRAVCREKGVALQLIKTICHGPVKEGEDNPYGTWYRPLSDPADITTAVHWALGVEEAFVNTAADTGLLPHILDAAAHFEAAPDDHAMAAWAEKSGVEPLFA